MYMIINKHITLIFLGNNEFFLGFWALMPTH